MVPLIALMLTVSVAPVFQMPPPSPPVPPESPAPPRPVVLPLMVLWLMLNVPALT